MAEISRKQNISIQEWWELAGKLEQEGTSAPLYFKVTGGSMVPLIGNGRDEVAVFRREGTVRKGDIVLFKARTRHGNYVLHRVYQKRGDLVQTLGDGNLSPDFWMPLSNIYGVARFLKRGNRELNLDAFPMRVYGQLWMSLLPVRKYLLRAGAWWRQRRKME